MFKVGDKVKRKDGGEFSDDTYVTTVRIVNDNRIGLNTRGQTWERAEYLELVHREEQGEYVYLIIGTYSDGPDSLIGAFNDHEQAEDVLEMIKRSEPMLNVRKEAVKLR